MGDDSTCAERRDAACWGSAERTEKATVGYQCMELQLIVGWWNGVTVLFNYCYHVVVKMLEIVLANYRWFAETTATI